MSDNYFCASMSPSAHRRLGRRGNSGRSAEPMKRPVTWSELQMASAARSPAGRLQHSTSTKFQLLPDLRDRTRTPHWSSTLSAGNVSITRLYWANVTSCVHCGATLATTNLPEGICRSKRTLRMAGRSSPRSFDELLRISHVNESHHNYPRMAA